MHGNHMRSISSNIYKSFLLTGLLTLCFFAGISQSGYRSGITANVNRRVIALGEQFELTLSYSHPVAELPKKVPYVNDTFPHFEVVNRKKADTAIDGDMRTIRQVFVVTSFDTGHWSIPPFVLVSGKNNISSDSIGIDITPVPLSSDSYHDIKEIIDVPDMPFDWKKWIGILVTVIVLAAGIWYYIKNRKKPVVAASRFDSKLSPLEQALQDISRLKQEGLPEKGEMKKYYTRLGDIFRIYLERQVAPGFMQYTTDEILIALKGKQLHPEGFSSVAEVLRIADAVKFAKYSSSVPEAGKASLTVEEVLKQIQQTKQVA